MTQLSLIDEPTPPQQLVEDSPSEPAKVHIGPKLQEYRRNAWNHAAQKTLLANPVLAQKVVISFIAAGKGNHIKDYKLAPFFKKVTGEESENVPGRGYRVGTMLGAVDPLEQSDETKLITAMAIVLIPDVSEEETKTVLQYLGVNIGDFWTIDTDFLLLLTKQEIIDVAKEIGIHRHMGIAFSKMSGGKKEEFVRAILESGFDFNGKIPAVMQFI